MRRFDGRRALVVGLGSSGIAATEALLAEGADVRVSEHAAKPSDADVLTQLSSATLYFDGHRPEHLDDIDLAVVSPGVPEYAPIISWLQERQIPIWSELELGARLTRAPLVVITGTNGKSTTTEMVAACMRSAGLDAVACGNLGLPFSQAARAGADAFAVEASSFQLRFITSLAPKVSVLLNIADDHVDWHGSVDAYEGAKARVFAFQGDDGTHIGNADDPRSGAISRTAPVAQRWFTLEVPAQDRIGYVGDDLTAVVDGAMVSLGVPHSTHRGFRADAAAAAAAGLAFGLEPDAIRRGLGSIQPMAHRGELVATIDGVRYLDDSKATNPHAVLAALDGMQDVVLICGGLSKGIDLAPMVDAADALVAVVAIGEAAGKIEDLFSGIRPVDRAESLDQAVAMAARHAVPSGTVLLAPGCASQDMFIDYKDRGDRFADAVRRSAANEGGDRA